MLEEEEEVVKKTIKTVCQALDIKKEIFENTHKKLSNHAKTCEFVMAAQQGKLKQLDNTAIANVKISKEKTMQYLKKQQD